MSVTTERLQSERAAAEVVAKERRRRPRARISAPVRVRSHNTTTEIFQDVCMSSDASRDGLYFTTARENYFKGTLVAVTFPYSTVANAINTELIAEIVRVTELPEGQRGVGVRFIGPARVKSTEGPRLTARPTQQPKNGTATAPLILAVDADKRGRDILRLTLEHEGYAVKAVATGMEALEVLRTDVPYVLIADMEAEDMPGHDLCFMVKNDERLHGINVVLTTRSAQTNDYMTAHAMGAVICMAKPYKPERLLHVVHLLAPVPELPKVGNGNRSRRN